MAEILRHATIYEDLSSPGDSIGVRDDGFVHVLYGQDLRKWRRLAMFAMWDRPRSAWSQTVLAHRGEILGSVSYRENVP